MDGWAGEGGSVSSAVGNLGIKPGKLRTDAAFNEILIKKENLSPLLNFVYVLMPYPNLDHPISYFHLFISQLEKNKNWKERNLMFTKKTWNGLINTETESWELYN